MGADDLRYVGVSCIIHEADSEKKMHWSFLAIQPNGFPPIYGWGHFRKHQTLHWLQVGCIPNLICDDDGDHDDVDDDDDDDECGDCDGWYVRKMISLNT